MKEKEKLKVQKRKIEKNKNILRKKEIHNEITSPFLTTSINNFSNIIFASNTTNNLFCPFLLYKQILNVSSAFSKAIFSLPSLPWKSQELRCTVQSSYHYTIKKDHPYPNGQEKI